MPTLLEKANAATVKRGNAQNAAEMEALALAWVRDEVRLAQIAIAVGTHKNNAAVVYRLLATSLKDYIRGRGL